MAAASLEASGKLYVLKSMFFLEHLEHKHDITLMLTFEEDLDQSSGNPSEDPG